jgi:hypothetical protein
VWRKMGMTVEEEKNPAEEGNTSRRGEDGDGDEFGRGGGDGGG